jgi:hypothetical protein
MNHRHRQVLHAIFEHPEPANLAASDIRAVLGELGAEIEERTGGRYAVTLGGHTVLFHHTSHSVDKTEIRQLRRFLIDRAIEPQRDYPL